MSEAKVRYNCGYNKRGATVLITPAAPLTNEPVKEARMAGYPYYPTCMGGAQ